MPLPNKVLKIAPILLTTAAANLLNSALGSLAGPVGFTVTQPYIIVKKVRATNITAGALTCSMFIGATGGSVAGTAFAFSAKSVPANDSVEWYGQQRIEAADFLTGLAQANNGIVIEITAEIGFS